MLNRKKNGVFIMPRNAVRYIQEHVFPPPKLKNHPQLGIDTVP